MALKVLGRRHLVVHADTLLLEVIFSANKRRFDQSAVITVQRGATHTQLARTAYPLKVIEAAKFHVADQNYSRSERFSQKGHTKSPAPSRGRISAPRVRSADGSRTNHRTRRPSRAQPGPHRNAMGELQGASRKNFIRCRGLTPTSALARHSTRAERCYQLTKKKGAPSGPRGLSQGA